MITRIRINNYKSIEKTDVSFLRGKYDYANEYLLNDTVANPIAIYGKNGSGKTSFLTALEDLSMLMGDEVDNLGILIPNLSLNNNTNKKTSIVIDFRLDTDNYCYGIETKLDGIHSEYLIVNGKTILERNENEYYVSDRKYNIVSNLYPALRDYYNRNNTIKELTKAYDFLSNIAYLGGDKRTYYAKSLNNVSYKDIMVEKSAEVKDILKSYEDFPIYDVISATNKQTGKKDYYAVIDNNGHPFTLPLSFISSGMHNQSVLISILLTLPENGTLVVDELEDALHPLTTMNFINLAVKRKVQLIFVSHNTNTLSHLRPDNIVFANWKNGASSYKRLMNIYPNIRKVNNIEKMYLSSTFDEVIEK